MRSPPIPETTSASQLVAYASCPRKYAMNYCWGVESEFKSTALILGTIVHAGIGWWHEERLAGRAPTLEALDRIVEADVLAATLDDGTIRWKKDADAASLEADAKRFLRVYLAEYGELPVRSTEALFSVPLVDPDTGRVLGRDLKGFFDLILADNRVVEIKTSARGWRADDLARHLQVGAYAYVWNMLHGGPSQIDVLVIIKLKGTPRVERYSIERGEADTRWFVHAAAAIEAAIEARVFPPSPSMLCNECEYQKACLSMTGGIEAQPTESREQKPRRLEVVA